MAKKTDQNGNPDDTKRRDTSSRESAPPEGGSEVAASAATQKVPATGTESFAEDLDMEKIPDSIRKDYFAAEQDGEASADGEAQAQVPSPMSVAAMVDQVKAIFLLGVLKGLEALGSYLLIHVFDNDFKKVFSKNPYKGTSFADLARHADMPLSRQRLSECVRAAAVSREMEANEKDSSSVPFSVKIELGRIKNATERMEKAERAIAEAWTFQQTRKEVRKLVGTRVSEDARLSQTVLRQVGELIRLSTDEDAKELIGDKDRLKAAMKRADRLKLLTQTEEARKQFTKSARMLKKLEKTLWDIEVEDRKAGESESEEDDQDSDNPADE